MRQGKPHACGYKGREELLSRGMPLYLLLPIGYRASLRQALIDDNTGHVNVIVCEADYKALKRGIELLPPPVQ